MTGFARSEASIPDGRIVWEVRSVNHRYLDAQFRLPEGFRAMEPELKDLLARRFSRGKIDSTLSLQYESSRIPQVSLNLPFAKELIHHAETLNRQLASSGTIDTLSIMRWPGVILEEEIQAEALFPDILAEFEKAIAGLAEHRAREGERIQKMLRNRCDEVENIVVVMRQRLPVILDAIQKRLTERVRTLVDNIDQDRLEQELVLIAKKLDVSEELDRLEAHIAEVLASFSGDEPMGRRLDFLMQEFNREANTLASKSADTDTTQHAIELKVLIEQMREQIQNVE